MKTVPILLSVFLQNSAKDNFTGGSNQSNTKWTGREPNRSSTSKREKTFRSHRIIQRSIRLFIVITHSINHLQRRMLRIIQSKNTEIYDDI